MTITVKLRVRVADKAPNIWRIFPGEGYAFLRPFVDENLIYLDLPTLELGSSKLSDIPDLYDRVLYASRVARMRGTEGVQKVESRSPRGLEDWPKRLVHFKGALLGLFDRAEQGDIVVVPGRHYASSLAEEDPRFGKNQIGVLLDGPKRRTTANLARYDGLKTSARRVRWLGTFSDADIGQELSSQLRTQNPFVSLGKSASESLLPYAYDNFISQTESISTFSVNNHDFSLSSDLELLIALKGFALGFQAIETKTQIPQDDFFELTRLRLQAQYDPLQECVIRSPGNLRFRAPNASPLVLAALFALAACSELEGENYALDDVRVELVGDLDGGSPLEVEIVNGTENSLKAIGYENWKKLRPIAVSAMRHSDIAVDAEVVVDQQD